MSTHVEPWMEAAARELTDFWGYVSGFGGCKPPTPQSLAGIIARHAPAVGELVAILREILDRFPQEEVIEDLKADIGYGYRQYEMRPHAVDSDIVKWRAALAAVEKGRKA